MQAQSWDPGALERRLMSCGDWASLLHSTHVGSSQMRDPADSLPLSLQGSPHIKILITTPSLLKERGIEVGQLGSTIYSLFLFFWEPFLSLGWSWGGGLKVSSTKSADLHVRGYMNTSDYSQTANTTIVNQ